MKDNRELFRKNKEEKEKNAPTCRVCGSKEIHSLTYSQPSMKCIQYLRAVISQLEDKVNEYEWALNPDRMGQ